MILKESEEKRSILWRVVMSVSSLLIVIIAVFFIVRLFTANPLEGKWVSEDDGMVLEVKGNGILTVTGKDSSDTSRKVNVAYTVDKETKTFNIQASEEEIREEAAASGMEEASDGMCEVAESLSGVYDYNIERNKLTLTEREYGDQMSFTRK